MYSLHEPEKGLHRQLCSTTANTAQRLESGSAKCPEKGSTKTCGVLIGQDFVQYLQWSRQDHG